MSKNGQSSGMPQLKSEIMRDRFLTVSLYPEPKPHRPWIRLCGLWLLDAGFTPQTRVQVKVAKDQLVIVVDR